MIYIDIDEIGHKPYLEIWVKKQQNPVVRELLNECIAKYLDKVLTVKKTRCKELVVTSQYSCVINLCKLFD